MAASLTTKDLEEFKSDLKCKICASLFEDPVVLPCGHVFCKGCTMENLNSNSNCPLCRAKYSRRSFYPIEPINKMCQILMELGETLGVADIAATQMSQVIPIKPFVPLQRPEKFAGFGGEVFSQHLREAKSQRPDEISDSDSESDATSSSSEAAHTHTYKKGCRKGWRCANVTTGTCRKPTKAEQSTRRDVYYCSDKKCSQLICVKCYEKQTKGDVKEQEEGESESESSGGSTSSEDDEDGQRKCVLCRLTADDQESACENRLRLIGKRIPRVTDGVLWKMDSATMNENLKGLEGPFTVTWNRNYNFKGTKRTSKLTKSVYAHDLCLLWSPQTKFKGDETSVINPRSVAPAVRNGLNKTCSACGAWGASLICKKQGCGKAYHIPCGLFTSAIGSIDKQSFTVCCAEHATAAKKRKR
eukprot:TRINITY_DN42109_c0_g1_i1.p1 TRINITY_DN42109_c0_g1~~TRINITY_DN42109_c0_g1_i1.p1  ORF type:complete len:416 (+),score=40.61 TRINITY_DN42109_c0_g1_i1:72-1319(+)